MSETGALARPDDRSNRTAKTASRRRIPGAGRQAPADSAGLGEAARRDAMARKLAEAASQHDAPRGDHARSGASKVPSQSIPGAGRQAPARSAGLGRPHRRDAMARKLAEAQAVSQHDAPRGDHARSGASKVPARLRYERVPGAWRRAEAAFKALGESARRDAMARKLAEAQAASQHDAPRGDHARSGASKVPARLRYERVPGAWRRAEAAFKALGESARRDAMARRRVHTRGQGVDRGDVDAGEGVGRGVATGEGVGSGDVDTGGGALAGDSRRSTLHASRKRPRPPARDRKLAERRLPPRR